jgi:PAS domain S-box-containing protein
MNFPLNELNLLLIILLSAAAVLVSILAYKIRLLQKDYDRLLRENKEDSRILFLKSRYASMGETVGNIAHQWKQPLNAIGSIQNSIKAALVFKGEISKEKLLHSVESSFKLLQHLAETIDTFYSFLAQQGDDKTRFVVADELEKVRKITEYSFENSHITLNYELEINPTIQGNANEFTHAILNLILNAKDAFDGVSVDAPHITVRVSDGDKTCHITVTDNAGGIRLKPVDMVFGLHITTKEEGSGLGLFMTKNIIENRFGGKISVKNVKGGACFTILLPYAEYGKHCADTVTPDERLTLDRINQLSRKIIELEEVEKALKKWADIFEQAQWGIVMCGADTMTLDLMNPAFAQMHGFEVNELIKKPIESIFAPEYRDQVECILHTVHQENHYAFESVHIRKDGSRFPVAIDITAVKDDNNNILYRIANVRDITAYKEAQERLLLKQFALDTINEAVYLIDENSMFYYVNDGACKALSYAKEELLAMGVVDIDPNCSIGWWGIHWEDIKRHKTVLGQASHRKKDGSVFPIEVSSNYFEYNGVGYSLAVARDITERRLLEAEKENRIIKTVAENSPDVIIRYDTQGRRTYANPKARELFGVVLGKSPSEETPIIDKEYYVTQLHRVIDTGVEATFEITYTNAISAIDYSHIRMVPEFGDDGKISSVLMIGRDITELKQALHALEIKEQELRALAESSPGMMGSYYLRPDGSVCMPYTSPNIVDLFGVTPEEVADEITSLTKLHHPDDHDRILETIAESARDMSVWHQQYRILHPTKGIRWMESNTMPNPHPEGGIIWYGYVHDITERKAMEALLQEANDRYIQILDNSSDVIYLLEVTPEGRFVYVDVNAAYEEVTGIPRDVVIGLDVEDIEDETFRTILTDKFTSCLNAGEKTNYTADYPFPAGIRTFHSILLPIRDESGRIVRIVGAARDITERQEIEESLKKALEFNEGIIAAIPDLLFEIAPDGTYVGIWAQNEELLVAQRELLLGKNFKEILPPDVVITSLQAMKEVDEKGFSLGNTYSLDLPDGKRWFELSVTKKKSSGNYIVLSRDITERKKIEEQLQRSETSLKEAQKIAKMGSWELEISTQKLTWSDETYRLFEIDKEQGDELHTIFYDSVHPDDREMVKSTFEESLKTKQPFEIVHRIVMGDGRIKYVLESCETQYDAAGSPVLAIGAVQDITERKQAEDMIRELNTTLEERVRERTAQLQLVNTAVNSSTEAIYITDETLSILYVNDGACHMLGYTRDELTGMKVYDIDVLFSAESLSLIREHTLSAKHTLFETKHRTKKGRILDVEIAGSSFVFNGTEVEVSVVKDITFKKEVDKRLRLVETAMNHASEAVYIVGDDRSILYVSEGACRMLGYSVEELMGMKVYEIDAFMNKEEIDAVKEHVACADEFTFETKHRAKDGHVVDVEITVTAFEYEDVRLRLSIVKEISERKKIEALQQERLALEERLSKIAAAAPGVNYIFEKTAEGTVRFTYLAPGFEELFGLCTDAAMNDFALVMQLVHPDDRDAIRQSITVTAEELGDWREEFRVIHPLKGVLWIEGQSSPELQPDGSIVWYGFFYDATERKDAEEALAKSEETFRAMVENSPDVIIRYDLECRRTYINPMGQLLMGKSLEEIIGKTPSEYSPLPESVEFEKLFARVVSEGKEIELESPYRTSEGEMRIGHQRIVPELNAQGKVVSVMVIGRDITEQKKVEEALITSEQRYKEIFENSSDLIYLLEVVDADHYRYLAVNRAFENASGVSRELVIGRYAGENTTPDTARIMNDAFRRCVTTRQVVESTEILDLPSGRKHFRYTLIPVLDTQGDVERIIALAKETTE